MLFYLKQLFCNDIFTLKRLNFNSIKKVITLLIIKKNLTDRILKIIYQNKIVTLWSIKIYMREN